MGKVLSGEAPTMGRGEAAWAPDFVLADFCVAPLRAILSFKLFGCSRVVLRLAISPFSSTNDHRVRGKIHVADCRWQCFFARCNNGAVGFAARRQRTNVGPCLSFPRFVHDELPSARGNVGVAGRRSATSLSPV